MRKTLVICGARLRGTSVVEVCYAAGIISRTQYEEKVPRPGMGSNTRSFLQLYKADCRMLSDGVANPA